MSTQSLASFSSSLAISSGVAKVPGPKVSKRCDKGGGCSSSAKTELKKTKGTHIKVPIYINYIGTTITKSTLHCPSSCCQDWVPGMNFGR